MSTDSDSATFKITNAARLVLNAIATETGPLITPELFLTGCDLVKTLRSLPCILEVGDKKVDIPAALRSVEGLDPNDAQRIGIEQMAEKWRQQTTEFTLSASQVATLKMQLKYILPNQGEKPTVVRLSLTASCEEAIRVLQAL
ncbi:MAG: hypothetical protein WC869_00485 [Phycisphaerae bacterium]|jgi:hypothetical protein